MKRKIRFGVFETNSSSSHSITIYNMSKKKFMDIPKNSTVILNNTYSSGIEIFDEMGKLNFVVTLLASIVERRYNYDEIEINSFEEMVNLNWFKWLAEVVNEESNTEVIYKHPTYYNGEEVRCVPYYGTTYDDNEDIESIFCGGKLNVLDDETAFKERVKDIIYNPSVMIEDKDNEY